MHKNNKMNKYVFQVVFLIGLIINGSLTFYSEPRNYHSYDEYGQRIGNPDDTAEIERPCPTYDLNCIRTFFENHAHCRKMFGPVPDPLHRTTNSLYAPRVNLTNTSLRTIITGTNGRVEEFYINRDTNRLVIAVEFRNQVHFAPIAYLKFHRRVKEPIVTSGSATVQYRSFIVTAVIPDINSLQLDKAECTTFNNDANNNLLVSPSAGKSNDPQVQRTLAEIYDNISVTIQELFLTDSAFYITAFIQYSICDFGIQLV